MLFYTINNGKKKFLIALPSISMTGSISSVLLVGFSLLVSATMLIYCRHAKRRNKSKK